MIYSVYDFNIGPVNNSVDLTVVTNLLHQRDFASIIKDQTHFRALFYKTIADANLDGWLQIRRNGNIITATGNSSYKEKIDKSIEIIRKCFDKAHGLKQNFTICGVHAACDDVAIEPLKDKYEYQDFFAAGTPKIGRTLFADLILPAVHLVAEQLAATCTLSKEQRVVNLKGIVDDRLCDLDVFSIFWSDREHFIYPVPPTLPQEHPNLSLSLYELYRSQQHCDLTIEDKDRNKIKVHSLPFLVCKSAKLQTLLAHALASKDKRLVLDTFSMEAIKKFIDFVYLGPKALDPNTWQSKELTTAGLLSLAHFLEMPAFMDSCTNLLSLTTSKEDAAHVNRLAKLYDNEHLRLLAAYLNGPEPAQSSSKRGKRDPNI